MLRLRDLAAGVLGELLAVGREAAQAEVEALGLGRARAERAEQVPQRAAVGLRAGRLPARRLGVVGRLEFLEALLTVVRARASRVAEKLAQVVDEAVAEGAVLDHERGRRARRRARRRGCGSPAPRGLTMRVRRPFSDCPMISRVNVSRRRRKRSSPRPSTTTSPSEAAPRRNANGPASARPPSHADVLRAGDVADEAGDEAVRARGDAGEAEAAGVVGLRPARRAREVDGGAGDRRPVGIGDGPDERRLGLRRWDGGRAATAASRASERPESRRRSA